MGLPPSHHGFKDQNTKSWSSMTRMIWGTPMTLQKKTHFGVSEHGYIPQMAIKHRGTTGDFCRFSPGQSWRNDPACRLQIPGAEVESQDLLGPGHLPQKVGGCHVRIASKMEEFYEEWTRMDLKKT